MARGRGELTPKEWELMDALWEAGQATATDLQQRFAGRQGWAYSTVKTMLDRLVAQDYVKFRRVGNVYEYTPRYKRPTVVGKLVDDVTRRIFGGSALPFIQTLIERNQLSDEEVRALRKFLDENKPKGGDRP